METVGIIEMLSRVQGPKEWDLRTQILQSERSSGRNTPFFGYLDPPGNSSLSHVRRRSVS